jgi:uncharacterized protein (TIGR03435 family)
MAWVLGMSIFTAVVALALPAQEPKDPAFEVASLKPLGPPILKPGELLGLQYKGNRVSGRTQLFALIQDAYGLQNFQLAAPDLGADMYFLDAIMPAGTTPETARGMFRTLLAERFGLRFHREMRNVPVYALIEDKGGMKLTPVDPEKAREQTVDTPHGPRKGISSTGGRGFFIATAVDMDTFAGNLGIILNHPVVNQTNRPGSYALDLRWSPDDPEDIIPLLPRQLGLKLERRTILFEMFVVDHVDQVPTAN